MNQSKVKLNFKDEWNNIRNSPREIISSEDGENISSDSKLQTHRSTKQVWVGQSDSRITSMQSPPPRTTINGSITSQQSHANKKNPNKFSVSEPVSVSSTPTRINHSLKSRCFSTDLKEANNICIIVDDLDPFPQNENKHNTCTVNEPTRLTPDKMRETDKVKTFDDKSNCSLQ